MWDFDGILNTPNTMNLVFILLEKLGSMKNVYLVDVAIDHVGYCSDYFKDSNSTEET